MMTRTVGRSAMLTTFTSFAAGQSAFSGIVIPYHSGGWRGPQDDRQVVNLVMLAFERQLVAGEALQDELEGLVINLSGLREVEAVSACLERRHAAPDPELEPPAAHLIEHADFLDQAQRMIERQEIDEGAEAQRLGALRHGREEQPGRGGAAERRRMMLGEGMAFDPARAMGFDQPEPIGVELHERPARIVHVVEHTEFHAAPPG